MLKKLFKYEWKSTSKVGVGLMVTALGMTLLAMLTLQIMFHFGSDENLSAFGIIGIIYSVLAILMFVICLIGVVYGMTIYLGVRFYKSMYRDEGYLSHTLPVTTHELLLSKILVGGIWSVLMLITMGVSYFLFFSCMYSMAEELNFFSAMSEFAGETLRMYGKLGMTDKVFVIATIVSAILGCFSAVSTLYGSLTLGQLVKKHRGLMGFVFYIGSMFVIWILALIGNIPFAIRQAKSYANYTPTDDMEISVVAMNFSQTLVTLVVSIVVGVVFYFIAHYINERKLNLE